MGGRAADAGPEILLESGTAPTNSGPASDPQLLITGGGDHIIVADHICPLDNTMEQCGDAIDERIKGFGCLWLL